MCGICGFIGQSKFPKVTHAFMTSLLKKTQSRGKEATGFWGAQSGKNGKIIYHKEPIPAVDFVKKEMWGTLGKFNPSILIAHCREPTQNVGVPAVNRNNHPHVNDNCQVALVHNGKVEEYTTLKHKGYEQFLRSQCDSEIILRIFERGMRLQNDLEKLQKRYPDVKTLEPQLYGVELVFSNLINGAMAVAVGIRHDGPRRSLWFFRDKHRPLWLVDMRQSIGQIFFCSQYQIWRDAFEDCPEARQHLPLNHGLIEFPVLHAYGIDLDETAADEPEKEHYGWHNGWRIAVYKLDQERTHVPKDEEEDLDQLGQTLEPPTGTVEVVTWLDENENVLNHQVVQEEEDSDVEKTLDGRVLTHEPEIEEPVTLTHEPDPVMDDKCFDLQKLSELVDRLRTRLDQMRTSAYNMCRESSITVENFQLLIDNLEQIEGDLQGCAITMDMET